MYKNMKHLLVIATSAMILFSCGGSGNKKSLAIYQSKIDSLEKVRVNYLTATKFPPTDLIKELIQVYEFRVADYPKDEKSAAYLFNAAQRYEMDLLDYKNAISRYQQVYDEYEEYENRPMALFHIGNAYHSLNDTTNAVAIFKKFQVEFPHHDFADDAQGMINYIRIGEDEFLRRIQQQEVQDSVAS